MNHALTMTGLLFISGFFTAAIWLDAEAPVLPRLITALCTGFNSGLALGAWLKWIYSR